jgi:hypothetical protein
VCPASDLSDENINHLYQILDQAGTIDGLDVIRHPEHDLCTSASGPSLVADV